ncbi:hypothetical protein LOK74_03340 [Brevibacillus humidisoli]|uniref:hypothetical protein n=1 Tax=Brevibacillus humidisoli TaxID=2895522 RepID=UPI001E572606|nr:hypothetical protein [Brevibacillus humidisoli]UFJ41579.1 hypothetical protein LOK74_03340 [Brevibacillus humidisoli]
MIRLTRSRPVRQLNHYYKGNADFKAWVKANEKWFMEHPDLFHSVLKNPNMVNLFVDLLVMNAPRIERKLKRHEK